ncbi:MAG: SUF system NifU family Fe-S cluster assembly protein [Acidimicrobiaceae bacterium]|nr:SUF system NifU family Fe-S cluster assembly protein [Acidimicrobiaceae bacterium]
MSGLEDLYKEIILDHYRSPRNQGELEEPAHRCEGFNPLCGDEVVVYLSLDGGTIDIKIGGRGCSISMASASMMSEIVKGKSIEEAKQITQAFKEMMDIYESELSGNTEIESVSSDVDLGDLEALQGVVKYPVRIKCATLAWNTLTQSIDEIQDQTH